MSPFWAGETPSVLRRRGLLQAGGRPTEGALGCFLGERRCVHSKG